MSARSKTALVTGGGTRLGRAIAEFLGKSGFDVAVHYHSNEAGAEEAVQGIRDGGRKAELFQSDLSEPTAAAFLAKRVLEEFGELDVLINGASFWVDPGRLKGNHSLWSETVENWDYTFGIHARAPFFLIQAFAETLGRVNQGLIVNLLDQSIERPFLSRASHTVSKAALLAITKLAAAELTPRVRVNGLELGAILPPEGLSPAELLSREWGGSESVTSAIMFLLESPFVNGEILGVRGSQHLANHEE